jgi:hypothetical protein
MKIESAAFAVIGFLSVAACSSGLSPSGRHDSPDSSSGGGSGGVSTGGISSGSGAGASGGNPGPATTGGSSAGDRDASSSGGASDASGGSTSSGSSSDAGDHASPDGGSSSGGEAGTVGMGQFDCTMNGADPMHHPGGAGEHEGQTFYGAVVDTSPGANRARVGEVQKTVIPASGFLKFVWPMILVSGHTYELAVFADMSKPPTHSCTSADRVWYWKIPSVSGSVVENFNAGNQAAMGYCMDFPTGPIP